MSLVAFQPVLNKLNKNLHLHEAIQTCFLELLGKVDSSPAMTLEEDRSDDVYGEHQELVREVEELNDYLLCHQEFKKLIRIYALFQDTFSMAIPKYEPEILKFRTILKDLMNRLQAITLEQSDYVQDDITNHQKDVMSCFQQFREKRHARTISSTSSSTTAPPPSVSYYALKIKIKLPNFSGEPTVGKCFHGPFTHAMDSRGAAFTEQKKLEVFIKSMKYDEARLNVEAYFNFTDCYHEAMRALQEKFKLPVRIFPILVRKLIEQHHMDYTEEGLVHLRKLYYNPLKDMKDSGCDSLSLYFAAFACENVVLRLLEEWTKHTASYSKEPDIDDLMTYARRLNIACPACEEHPSLYLLLYLSQPTTQARLTLLLPIRLMPNRLALSAIRLTASTAALFFSTMTPIGRASISSRGKAASTASTLVTPQTNVRRHTIVGSIMGYTTHICTQMTTRLTWQRLLYFLSFQHPSQPGARRHRKLHPF